MKIQRHFRSFISCFPLLAGLLGWASAIQAAETAFVFNTDGGPLPSELINTIVARRGAGTAILEIRANSTAQINGVPVKSMGAVALPRFDNAGFPAPMAHHYLIAGDLKLATNQSIWGWGDLLLKLEVTGNATLVTNSLVAVSAIGRLGGAGGGDGGLPTPFPLPSFGFNNFGGEGGYGARRLDPQARPGYPGRFNGSVPQIIGLDPHVSFNSPDYARSFSGGAGTNGQGDAPSVASTSPGGAGQAFPGPEPGGGLPGNGGLDWDKGSLGGQFGTGDDGGGGGRGDDGTPAVNGASAPPVSTLAGVGLHLRGGSGGGAGATGGLGLKGRGGGGGGGGGANNIFGSTIAGGNGAQGGDGGPGGVSGIGGAGGGGGGGLQLLVRGKLTSGANFEAKGGNGVAGTPGGAGSSGQNGGTGERKFFNGTKGGDGGRGGNGGKGGNGGNGASGSGGNIQIVASECVITGTANTAGGTGAPAGLVQIHSFSGTTQNAPFGVFAARTNAYRSYVVPNLLFPIDPDPATTPMLTGLQGGPAPYGLMAQGGMGFVTSTVLQPPTETVGMVVRLQSSDLSANYPNHDVLVFTSVKYNLALNSPAWNAINPGDVAAAQPGQILPYKGVYPANVMPLVYNAGYANDPAIFPGASGPTTGPLPADFGYVMFVEKGKLFDVTARFTPYFRPREFHNRPEVGSLSGAGGYPARSVLLNDLGLVDIGVWANTGFETNQLFYTQDEISQTLQGSMFIRVGTTNARFRYVSRQIGNFDTFASGFLDVAQFDSGGLNDFSSTNYLNVRAGTGGATVASNTITVPSGGWSLNTTSLVGQLVLMPDYDDRGREIFCKVYGKFVGPELGFSPEVQYVPGGPLLKVGTLYPGQSSIAKSFRMANYNSGARPVPASWQSFLDSHPQLQRLTVRGMEIVGPGASAFSLIGSTSFSLNSGPLGPDIVVRFTPPRPGNYVATLRILTDKNADYQGTGDTYEIQLQATALADVYSTWALSQPEGKRGVNDDGNSNGIPNLIEYAWGTNTPQGGLTLNATLLPNGTTSNRLGFTLPISERQDVRWRVEGSPDLITWQPLATRTASNFWSALPPGDTTTETAQGSVRKVGFTHFENRDHYFFRLKAGIAAPNDYTNDFSTNARAELRGAAVLTNGALRLTDAIGGQAGAVVLTGVEVWPGQTGFEASFNLAMGPIGGVVPADGVSFSVGDLSNAAWGENGPNTARHLTVAFDTYENGAGQVQAKGIRLMMGTNMLAYSNTDPYSNGSNVPVVVSFTPTGGASVWFNGVQIFTSVPVPGFVLQPGDRYGFGARTGGFNQVSKVDDVVIGPR